MSETLPGVHPGQVLAVHVGPDTRSVSHFSQFPNSLDVNPSRDSDVGASRHHGVSARRLKNRVSNQVSLSARSMRGSKISSLWHQRVSTNLGNAEFKIQTFAAWDPLHWDDPGPSPLGSLASPPVVQHI